jgi:ribosomal protein S18 acetylase RimI-like enzyme
MATALLNPFSLPQNLSFRPITDPDAPFLLELYASTRQAELAAVPWTQDQKAQFLQQQFHAQHQFYQQQFAGARFDLVLHGGQPIGRLYVSRQPDEIRVIDIALLPEHRGRGIGAALMKSLQDEAAGVPCPIRIHVEPLNPALRLYTRLGFRKVQDQGVYWLMEWPPPNR